MGLNEITNAVKGFPPWMLLGAGFLGGYLKNAWHFVYDHTIGWLTNKCKIELVIEEQDHLEAFVWINMWMEEKLRKKKISKLRVQKSINKGDNQDKKNSFEILPSYGFYWFWWRKKLLTFYSEKKDSGGGSGYEGSNKLLRTITLEIWGTRNREFLIEILIEARDSYEKLYPRSLKYYTHGTDYWDNNNMQQRDMSTIYLPEELKADVLKDFQLFFESKDKYRSLGIPWRRGYILEGPPGTGKSSFIQSISSELKVPIYYFNPAKLSASAAMELLGYVNAPCIVLIEDIDSLDAAGERKESGEKDKESSMLGMSTSELLNLMDGLIATEQRILIMTTNHPDKLDKALIRPGRVDRRFHLGYSRDQELKLFYSRASEYYPLPSYEEFRKKLPQNTTIAEAQGLVFQLQSLTENESCDTLTIGENNAT